MEELKLMVPCLMGLEKIVSDELRRLGMGQVKADNGHVTCMGTLADIPRLNLWLRWGPGCCWCWGSSPPAALKSCSGGQGHRLGGLDRPGRGVSGKGLLHLLPAPQRARLPVHCQEGGIPAPVGAVRPGVAAGDRLSDPDPVLHSEGSGHHLPGHLRGGPLQTGLPGGGGGRPAAGNPGGGIGDPVPVQGAGPLPGPLLRQRHHPHRGGPDRQNRAPGGSTAPSPPRSGISSRLKYWMDAVEEALDKEFHGTYDIWGGDLDPRRWRLPVPTPSRPRWRIWSALRWPTPWNFHAPRASTAGW